ncbi:MAG: alpha/beta hydrolase [Acidobacteria bacterium]|nr:alpha/beta hydrolase [Acidobacteriota bacterium]
MKPRTILAAAGLAAALLVLSPLLHAQSADANFNRVVQMASTYDVELNLVYRTANNWDAKLDILRPRRAQAATPTVMYFHGGGWTNGTKDSGLMSALPYLEMGWAVVNVEYRMASVSLAPAAVEDARCAMRWVYRHAKEYNFDLNRLVLTGNSAGAHLALIGGMLTEDAGLDLGCPGDRGAGPVNIDPLKVAAIVNWYGISDVRELLDGPNRRPFAVMWHGGLPNREQIATQVSPLTHVRRGLPPVITIHGDADPTVPYTQALRLREALDKVGVANQLVTVPNGGHGGFSVEENLRIYAAIRAFLEKHVGGSGHS